MRRELLFPASLFVGFLACLLLAYQVGYENGRHDAQVEDMASGMRERVQFHKDMIQLSQPSEPKLGK